MDLVRAISNDRQKFARAVFSSKRLPTDKKRQLLLLCKRSEQDLILDVICEYFRSTFGTVPLSHESLEIPAEFLPKEFDEWLSILREATA